MQTFEVVCSRQEGRTAFGGGQGKLLGVGNILYCDLVL